MVNKVTKLLFISVCIFLLSFSVKIEAGQGCCSWHEGESGCSGGKTVCSDGWISSCGCEENRSNTGVAINNYLESKERGERIELFLFFMIAAGFIMLCIYGSISEKKENQRKIEMEAREKKQRKINEIKEKMKLLETKYISDTSFINEINKEIEENNLTPEILNDGYLHNIDPLELFKKIKLKNSDEKFIIYKAIVDKLAEKNKGNLYYYNLSLGILKNDFFNYNFFEYIINKRLINDGYTDCYMGKLIEEAIMIKNYEALQLLIKIDVKKSFNYNSLKNIINNYDEQIIDKICDGQNLILTDTFDLQEIYTYNDKVLFNMYIDNEYLMEDELNSIFKDIIYLKKIDLIKILLKKYTEKTDDGTYILSNYLSQNLLIDAYKTKDIEIVKTLIQYGFNQNLFSSLENQRMFEKYLNKEQDWCEVHKVDRDSYFNKQVASYIRNNNYELFKSSYLKLNSKEREAEEKGETLLFLAIKYNRMQFVDFMLKNNSCLDRLKNFSETNGISPLIFAVYKRKYKIINIFIENGANINYPDEKGFTTLDYAISGKWDLKLCKILVDNGAVSSLKGNYSQIIKSLENNTDYTLPTIYISTVTKLRNRYNKKDY